jgi:hypothetical protein
VGTTTIILQITTLLCSSRNGFDNFIVNMSNLIGGLRTLNQLLTAGIAITAFSLLLYALSFNLRDRVARSFAIILICVVVVFVGDAIGSVAEHPISIELWFKVQWAGLIFLPPSYLHFSDALLATTGRPSRGRRRRLIRWTYVVSLAFFIALLFSILVGPLVADGDPSPYLERTSLSWLFTFCYISGMTWAWVNFLRAYRRTVTTATRRRMRYLIIGALAPAFGSYPFLLFGSGFAADHPLFFWLAATFNNVMVAVLLFIMAYAVAFFGVPWPDRVVKRRLFKWVMRGPVTASTVLSVTTLVRRAGERLGTEYSAAVPIVMIASLLLMQYMITMLAPIWERWLFYGGDRDNLQLLQTLEERLLTTSDLRQFLESVLTAVCDFLQVEEGFVVALSPQGIDLVVTVGHDDKLQQEELSKELSRVILENGSANGSKSGLSLFSWENYWLIPLFEQENGEKNLLGLLGAAQNSETPPDDEQRETIKTLVSRAALALEDRSRQSQVFSSLETLAPQVDLIQRLRAAANYDGSNILMKPEPAFDLDQSEAINKWVKDALSHYWGGPKLSESPLVRLQVVQQALETHNGVSVNALRAILRQAIEKVRPEGERRFTGEWILYNILEMKFMEGRKVREIALRLAMSEADLYRKQRVAIEAVANAILEMEDKAREEVIIH